MPENLDDDVGNTQAGAIARRGVTSENQTAPAAEHSEYGGAKPLMSNDAEERLFRPGD